MTEAAFETASWPRRIRALFVDWTLSTFIVIAIIGLDEYSEIGALSTLYVNLVYVVEASVLTWFAGGSFGKILTGLRVVPVDGRVRPLNPLKVVVRQLMIVLVIPPLVFRPDGRGLHDMFAGTATVTMPTFKELTGNRS
ncbi:MAG: RDD family protein [Nocardioides sp.]